MVWCSVTAVICMAIQVQLTMQAGEVVRMGPLGPPQQGGRRLLFPQPPQGEGQPRQALVVPGLPGCRSRQLLERGAGPLPVPGLQVERVAQPAPPGVGSAALAAALRWRAPGPPGGQHPADIGDAGRDDGEARGAVPGAIRQPSPSDSRADPDSAVSATGEQRTQARPHHSRWTFMPLACRFTARRGGRRSWCRWRCW